MNCPRSPWLTALALASGLPAGASAQGQNAPPPPPPPAVKVGQAAPDFTLPYLVAKPDGGFETRQVTLSSFKGKQNVVVAFFPAAFSPG
jgi:hypothetical protein